MVPTLFAIIILTGQPGNSRHRYFNTNMKKCVIALALMCYVFLLSSCSSVDLNDGATETISDKASTSLNPYDFIGEIHNSAMDSLKTKKVNQEQLILYTNNIVDNNFKNVKTYTEGGKIENVLTNIIKRSNNYELTTRTASLLDDSITINIPKNCLPYIDRIREITDLKLSDSLTIIKNFNVIDELVNKDSVLNLEEKAMLLAISAIGKYSSIYNRSTIETRAVSAGSVARADLEGAIGGVITWKCWGRAAASGLVFGPSGVVLTVAKEAVRGAIVGSAVGVVSGWLF